MIGTITAGLLSSVIKSEFSVLKIKKAKEPEHVTGLPIPSLIEKNVEADVEAVETTDESKSASLNQALFTDSRSFLLLAEQQAGQNEPIVPPGLL